MNKRVEVIPFVLIETASVGIETIQVICKEI